MSTQLSKLLPPESIQPIWGLQCCVFYTNVMDGTSTGKFVGSSLKTLLPLKAVVVMTSGRYC